MFIVLNQGSCASLSLPHLIFHIPFPVIDPSALTVVDARSPWPSVICRLRFFDASVLNEEKRELVFSALDGSLSTANSPLVLARPGGALIIMSGRLRARASERARYLSLSLPSSSLSFNPRTLESVSRKINACRARTRPALRHSTIRTGN